MEKGKNQKRAYYMVSTVILLVMLIDAQGPIIANDTPSYQMMLGTLPAFYPVFLKIFGIFFGHASLWAVILFQTAFAVIATVYIHETICDTFSVKSGKMRWLFLLLLLSVFFQGGEGVAPGGESTNLWILTEGISYPAFYLFVGTAINFVRKCNMVYYMQCMFWIAVMILVRKQLIECVLLAVVFCFGLFAWHRINWKKLMGCVAGMIIVIMMTGLLQDIYEDYAGRVEKDPYELLSVTGHLFLFSQPEDADRIADAEEKQLFMDTYSYILDAGYHYNNVKGSWYREQMTYINHYLKVREIVSSLADSYLSEQNMSEDKLMQRKYDILMRQQQALKGHTLQWIVMAIKQQPITLSMSISFYHPLIAPLSIISGIIIFAIYMAGNIFLMIKTRHIGKESIFCFCVLLFIWGNNLATVFMIRSIVRYVYYAWGLFYISGILLFQRLKDAMHRGNM